VAVASSISTYLDVTQAAEHASSRSAAATPDTASLEHAAKVLAAIHGGTEVVTELIERTGLETAQVLALISQLADAGMVEITGQDSGTLRVQLTQPTRAALDTA
jgi:predicted Rossmann fold nucleotide-binding protein DprA/Smf involved in DNA uptake